MVSQSKNEEGESGAAAVKWKALPPFGGWSSTTIVSDPVVGQHVPPQSALVGQQSPNIGLAFLTMAFAQCRLQQLMSVEHTWPLGLQPPARASVLTRSTVLATSAR